MKIKCKWILYGKIFNENPIQFNEKRWRNTILVAIQFHNSCFPFAIWLMAFFSFFLGGKILYEGFTESFDLIYRWDVNVFCSKCWYNSQRENISIGLGVVICSLTLTLSANHSRIQIIKWNQSKSVLDSILESDSRLLVRLALYFGI